MVILDNSGSKLLVRMYICTFITDDRSFFFVVVEIQKKKISNRFRSTTTDRACKYNSIPLKGYGFYRANTRSHTVRLTIMANLQIDG